MAAKIEYDLGYQKPDDDESSPPPEANTQDLGEGVEADICNREMNLSRAISSSKRRARNKTRWEEIRRRRDLNMKRRGESYYSASDSDYFSIGTDILLRNRFGIC